MNYNKLHLNLDALILINIFLFIYIHRTFIYFQCDDTDNSYVRRYVTKIYVIRNVYFNMSLHISLYVAPQNVTRQKQSLPIISSTEWQLNFLNKVRIHFRSVFQVLWIAIRKCLYLLKRKNAVVVYLTLLQFINTTSRSQ